MSTMRNADGQELFCRIWRPNTEPKALIFLCHGFGEHSGAYIYDTFVSQEFLKDGYLVFAHDHIGHGQSSGDRVHIDHFVTYCRDVKQHVTEMKEKYPSLPVFTYGHSMGGLISLRTAMMYKDIFDGVILSSPAIIIGTDFLPRTKVFLAKAVSWLVPQLEIATVDGTLMTRDEEVLNKGASDKLNWSGGVKAKWTTCILDSIDFVLDNANMIDFPLLVLNGDADKICDVSGAQLIYDKSNSPDKQLKVYPGYFHELHSEPGDDRIVVMNDVRQWITERL
ncbi:monoglyceride lipase-like [Tubulanus polymorphus]|uniref:monoglyceride lipase-like n=1 Tax=Tubulanus polymorphus TaxID=672921 RepID=UPI003DA62628